MRESVLRDLARRAADDPGFLSRARGDLEGTLRAHGYDLAPDELAAVRDLQRRTATMGDAALAGLLSGGLDERVRETSDRPAAPARPGSGISRPGRPVGPERRRPRPGGGPSAGA